MTDLLDRLGVPDRELLCRGSGGRQLVASRHCSEQFVRQLESVSVGSRKFRYQRLQLLDQLERLSNPVFVELEQHGRLVGTYCLELTRLQDRGRACYGVYRAVLSVDAALRGTGLGRWLTENTLEWIHDSSRSLGAPVLSWGCIDRHNRIASRLLKSLGAKYLGTLESMLIYRHRPRIQAVIEPLAGNVAEQIASDSDRRGGHHPAYRRRSLGSDYRVLRDGGRILAGARATLTSVRVLDQGGRWSRAYGHLLRHSAAARRRFDPEKLTYLRLSDLYLGEHDKGLWPDFINTLMAASGTYMAMIVVDPRSSAFGLLSEAGVIGRFARATRSEIRVVGQAWHGDGQWIERIRGHPLDIGPLDI